MLSLRTKISIWLTPVIAVLLLLSVAYYMAHSRIILQQLEQTTHQVLNTGGNKLNQFLSFRSSEFELITRRLNSCFPNCSITHNLLSNSLRHTTGFSLLSIVATDGSTLHTEHTINASNRYILRQDSQHIKLLPEALRLELVQEFLEWQAQMPALDAELEKLEEESIKLRERGERNSLQYRDIESRLSKLLVQKETPPSKVVFSGRQQSTQLGLPFNGNTFLFAQPLSMNDGTLLGFVVAYLDRSLIEDILYDIRQQLHSEGLNEVGIALVDNNSLTPLTEARFLEKLPLSSVLMDVKKLNLVPGQESYLTASYPIIDSYWLQQQLNKIAQRFAQEQDSPITSDSVNFRLLIAIGISEVKERQDSILLKVVAWALLSLTGLVFLIRYLSGHIVHPLVDLKHSIQSLSQGELLPHKYTDRRDEIGELARSFAHMSKTLHKKEHELFEMATTDPLTGCLNRRAFTSTAQAEHERALRSNQPLTLCLMDIDYFKRVNDRYGHNFGDKVLQKFSLSVRSLLRSSDKLGRFGGEEFIVLLPDTSRDGANLLAERLREAIATMEITEGETTITPVTVSIGITEWRPGDSYTEILSRVDKLLYRAKELGRNRVESYFEPEKV